LVLEFEATPEYLGQDRHAMALPPQWASYLGFDLCGGGGGDTTLGGVVARGPFSGMAGVSGLGDAPSWSGHPLNAVNAFGFGRLAWAPHAAPLGVVAEWAALTFAGSTPRRWQAWWACWATRGRRTKTSTASLGWGFVCAMDHYDMAPQARNATSDASASRGGLQPGHRRLRGRVQWRRSGGLFRPRHLPEELLLAFWNVPYTHTLRGARYGGMSVLDWIYASHVAGAAASAGFVGRWAALAGG
jgi:alpha-glucuronidase